MPEQNTTSIVNKYHSPLDNSQHERFAQGVFSGLSHTKAAIEAGYSPRTAYSQAGRLMKNVEVLSRIEALHELTAMSKVMSVRERKERLSEIARARLTDFVDIESNTLNIDLKAGNSAALQEVTVKETGGNKQTPLITTTTSVKLHDPVKSITELNKMDGAYAPEKVDISEGLQLLLDRLRGRRPDQDEEEAGKFNELPAADRQE